MKKGQVVFIHGGWLAKDKEHYYENIRTVWKYDPFAPPRETWYESAKADLAPEFDFLRPNMPNKQWVDYTAWSLWFEKTFEYLTGEYFVLMGESLGGLFVTKWLSENDPPKPIDQLHLVAPVFDKYNEYPNSDYGEMTHDLEKLKTVQAKVGEVYIYSSTDDPTISVDQSKKYLEYFPNAHVHTFEDRGHFFIPEFPELVTNVKKLI